MRCAAQDCSEHTLKSLCVIFHYCFLIREQIKPDCSVQTRDDLAKRLSQNRPKGSAGLADQERRAGAKERRERAGADRQL